MTYSAKASKSMLKNMHKGSEHVGKAPASLIEESSAWMLRSGIFNPALKGLWPTKNTKKAADLRDQIRRIESGQRV